MKFVVLCPDGAADWPMSALDNKTPLEVAHLPNIARLAKEGLVGRTQHAIEGVGDGSDVCCMSLLGFDPSQYHTGRAPLEAKSQGIELGPDQIAVRCNTVTIEDDIMVDYSAGHISTEESRALIEDLEQITGKTGQHFHPGIQYRHILLLDRPDGVEADCTAPHDITGKNITDFLPVGPDADILLSLMEASKPLFAKHAINQERILRKENQATQIWLWGQGPRPSLPTFQETFGMRGAMISAVDLLRSLGLYLDLEVLDVPGITGFTDTDYAAKGKASVEALQHHDLVFVHVEAPDECGHMGDAKQKTDSLEKIDSDVLGPILDSSFAKEGQLTILICPDHSTPCSLKAHATELIPFLAWGPEVPCNDLPYTENGSKPSAYVLDHGYELMGTFLKQAWK